MKNRMQNIICGFNTNISLLSLKLILSLLLALIVSIDMKESMTIHIATDEFGYWTAAANFVGFDWSDCASLNSYYSFGYGLILAPLLYFIKDPIILYKSAIVLNIILIQISFWLLYDIFKGEFNKVSSKETLLLCFGVSCYASNIFNTKLTLSECFLWFLFILIAWLFKQYLYTKCLGFLICLVALSGFIFMVHMRTITVFIAMCIALGANHYKKISAKKYITITVVLFLLLFFFLGLEEFIKNILLQAQYTNANEATLAMNDFGGQTSKLKFLISTKGIGSFITNFLGRIFYLGYSTFLIIYFGFYYCLRKIFALYKGINSNWHYLCIFIFLSTIFAIGISSVYMIYLQNNRQDILYYGRYSEYLIAPILIMGIIELIDNPNRFKLMFIFFGVQLLLTLFIAVVIKEYNMTTPLDVSIPALYYWLKKNNFEINAYLSASLIIILIAIFLCLIASKKRNGFLKSILLTITISCCWIHLGHSSYEISDTHKHDEAYNSVYEVIYENLSETVDCFYCFDDHDKEDTYYFMGIDRIQFNLKDEKINFKSIEYYDDIPIGSIIVIRTKSNCLENLIYKPNKLTESDEFIVYQK